MEAQKMSKETRVIIQSDATCKVAYGHAHEEDNRGRGTAPTQDDISNAREIKRLNANHTAAVVNYTHFFVYIARYAYGGKKQMDDNQGGREAIDTWVWQGQSEPVEIQGV